MSTTRARGMLALATAIAALAVAGTAQAMTVSVGTPDLTARVAIDVPVSVTCNPFSPGLVAYSQTVSVLVEQAAGTQIARGSTGVFNPYPALLFPCDGSAHTLTLTLVADPSGPPFHGGPAIVRASATATAGTPLVCCPGAFTVPFETQSISTLTEVRLH